MTRELELSQGLVALVDDEDYERASQFKWYATKERTGYYALRHDWDKDGKRSAVLLHRFILNAPADFQVDHKDLNKLNCQRANLRLCSPVQNLHNRKMQANNKSGYKGIYWKPRNKKWCAGIGHKGRNIHLGLFKTKEDAARAYDTAAKKLFGEFARLNFPD